MFFLTVLFMNLDKKILLLFFKLLIYSLMVFLSIMNSILVKRRYTSFDYSGQKKFIYEFFTHVYPFFTP